MSQLIWKNGEDVGIILDSDSKSITISAGNTAVHLDGEKMKAVIQGALVENHGGDKLEDLILEKPSGLLTLIPSTLTTPIPQSNIRLPTQFLNSLGNDTFTMLFSLLGG